MSGCICGMIPQPLFALGRVVATHAALDLLNASPCDPAVLLLRHQTGDWSDMTTDDALANLDSVLRGGRVFSRYNIGTERVWIITEADRASTTILLPSDY